MHQSNCYRRRKSEVVPALYEICGPSSAPPPRGRVQIKMQWGFCQQDCWLWAKSCKNWNPSKMKCLKSRLYIDFSSLQAVFNDRAFHLFQVVLNYILRYYNFVLLVPSTLILKTSILELFDQHWQVAKLLCQSQIFILFISSHIVYVLIQEAMVNL